VDWRAPATSESLIWTRSYFRAESEYLRAVPLWRNYRVQAVVLLVLTACVVVAFRLPFSPASPRGYSDTRNVMSLLLPRRVTAATNNGPLFDLCEEAGGHDLPGLAG